MKKGWIWMGAQFEWCWVSPGVLEWYSCESRYVVCPDIAAPSPDQSGTLTWKSTLNLRNGFGHHCCLNINMTAKCLQRSSPTCQKSRTFYVSGKSRFIYHCEPICLANCSTSMIMGEGVIQGNLLFNSVQKTQCSSWSSLNKRIGTHKSDPHQERSRFEAGNTRVLWHGSFLDAWRLASKVKFNIVW